MSSVPVHQPPRDAIRTFCRATRKHKAFEAEHAESVRAHNARQRDARASLRTLLGTYGATCLPAGNKQYIRLVKKKYKRALNQDIVLSALSSIDLGDLTGPDPVVIVSTVFKAIEAARVTVRDKVELSRHCAQADGAQGTFRGGGTCEEAAAVVDTYVAATADLRTLRQTIKVATAGDKSTAANVVPQVQTFLERANLVTQQISLSEEGGEPRPYNLRRRSMTRKPALDAMGVKTIIMRAIQAIREGEATDENMRSRLAEEIWTRMHTRPGKVSVSVTLEPVRT